MCSSTCTANSLVVWTSSRGTPWQLTGSERLFELWVVDICLVDISIHLVFESFCAKLESIQLVLKTSYSTIRCGDKATKIVILPYILNIKYQGVLCRKCNLTLVSNVCEAALISLFWAQRTQRITNTYAMMISFIRMISALRRLFRRVRRKKLPQWEVELLL